MDVRALFPQVAKSTYVKQIINVLNPMVKHLIKNPKDKFVTSNIALQLMYHPEASYEEKVVIYYLSNLLARDFNSFIDLYKQLSSNSSVLEFEDENNQ